MADSTATGGDPDDGDFFTVSRFRRSHRVDLETAPSLLKAAEGLAGLEIGGGSRRKEVHDLIPVEVSGDEAPSPVEGFSEVGLVDAVLLNVARCGYDAPTPVQSYALPIALAGRNLMACSRPGSGKTAAFCLSVVNGLLAVAEEKAGWGEFHWDSYGAERPRALLLAPTRKHGEKIYLEMRKFTYHTRLRVVSICGVSSMDNEISALGNVADILIASPGRLLDMVKTSKVSLDAVTSFVVDDADMMIKMGFQPMLKKIADVMNTPSKPLRQTMLFSPTLSSGLQELALDLLTD